MTLRSTSTGLRRSTLRPAAAATLAAAVLTTAAGCAPAGAPDAGRGAPTTAAGAPSASATPPPATAGPTTTPPPAAALSDATGLPGTGLVAARSAPLPGAAADDSARFSVTSGGVDRPYLLAPARRVAPGSRPALLVLLPAANTTLRKEYDQYGLDAFRDHGLSVLVAGTYAASWNAGRCCGRPQREGIDDVAALLAMRADAVRRSGADAARTAVVGHSVGALMGWRLACSPAFDAAAVVAVSGTLVSDCPPLPSVPAFLALNGGVDRTVPLPGSADVVTVLGVAPPPVPASLARLASAAGCPPPETTAGAGAATTTRAAPCRGGRAVQLSVVAGQGHPWADLDATRRTAAFLAETVRGVR